MCRRRAGATAAPAAFRSFADGPATARHGPRSRAWCDTNSGQRHGRCPIAIHHRQRVAELSTVDRLAGHKTPRTGESGHSATTDQPAGHPLLFGDRRDLGSMYDESLPTSGYGYACSATPSSDSPATPGAAGLGPGPGLSFGLIHPRTGPFTGGHPDHVRAARGRWRTPVNAMQHCWKACWRELPQVRTPPM